MNKKINILFLTHYSDLYGANRSLIDLIIGLRPHIGDLKVIVPENGPMCDELTKLNINYEIISFCPLAEYRWNSRYILGKLFWDFIGIIKGTNAMIKNLSFVLSIKKKLKDEFNVVYLNSSMAICGYTFSSSKTYQITHIRELLSEHYSIKPYFGFKWFYRIINKSDSIIMISHFLANKLKNHLVTSKSYVIYNGIQVNNFDFRKTEEKVFSFGIVGLIGAKKGQFEALRALYILADEGIYARLFVVGGGNVEGLKLLAKELRIDDRVIFTGFVEDVDYYYKLIDTCLICSENEAFGRVTIESMLHGIPIIGKDSGATSELIIDGNTGLLYMGGPAELARKMKLIYQDSQLRRDLSKNAFQFAETKFSRKALSQNILQIIKKSTEKVSI